MQGCLHIEQPRTTCRAVIPRGVVAYLERVRAYADTPAYQTALRLRSVWIEPLFAEAKQWHGLRRFRLCGLDNVNSEALLIASGQKLKRWLTTTDWGRCGGGEG